MRPDRLTHDDRRPTGSSGAGNDGPAPPLVTVTHPCAWCRRNYTSTVEPEYVGVVLGGGICEACYRREEAARGLEE